MKLILALTGRTYDTEPIVVLDIDGQRYWFSLPENTFRIDCSSQFKLINMRHLFVTSLSPESFAGHLLLGLAFNDTTFHTTGPAALTTFFQDHWLSKNFSISDELNDEYIHVRKINLHRTVAFDVQCHSKPGRFLPAVALSLGCPKGPLFKKLSNGENVVLEDGTVVEAHKCRGPDIPGERILFINCECDEDIDAIPPDTSSYDVIVHLTDMKLLNTDRYQSKFSPKSRHVCFPRSGKIVHEKHVARYEAIRSVCSDILSPISCSDQHEPYPSHFIPMDSGDQHIVESDKRAPQYLKPPQQIPNMVCPLPEFDTFAVTVLGTGGGIPSPERSLPAYLIHTRSGYILLDAGEGVVGQIYRKYGMQNGDEIMKKLACVWLSHLDADHVAGLTSLLTRRASVTQETLLVCCNRKTEVTIRKWQMFNTDYHIHFVQLEEVAQVAFGEIIIDNFPVFHRKNSFGCRITIENKWKVAYSGDRAARRDVFHELVGDVDCLIHEGTFEDFESDADVRHSTFAEAVEAGRLMHAKVTILTHLSRRYDEFIDTHVETALMGFDLLDFAFEKFTPDVIARMVNADRESHITSLGL